MKYEYLKRWRLKAKKWLVIYGGGKCQCCGYNKWRGNLSFHHINPDEKDITISNMLRCAKSWDTILIEADKCVLVCNNCHGEIHAGQYESPIIIGRGSRS